MSKTWLGKLEIIIIKIMEINNQEKIEQMKRVEESIKFYLDYHKVPEPARTMIIGNLLQVFKTELKNTYKIE